MACENSCFDTVRTRPLPGCIGSKSRLFVTCVEQQFTIPVAIDSSFLSMEQRRLNPDIGRRSISPSEIEDLSIGAGFKKRVWTQLLSSAALVGSRGTNQHHKVKLMAVGQMMTEISMNIRKAKGRRLFRVFGELPDEPVEITFSGRNKPGSTFRSSDRALAGPRQPDPLTLPRWNICWRLPSRVATFNTE